MGIYDYKLPNRKKWLLTDAFLQDFKEELDKINNIKPEDKVTYWKTYAWLEHTVGFYGALKVASEKHNVTKAIYEYAKKCHGTNQMYSIQKSLN